MKKENNPVSQEKFKTLIGGQALIEGIMMQGPDKRSIVVRGPEGLVTKVEPLKKRTGVAKWPLIRGVVNFASSMVSGVKALMYSAVLPSKRPPSQRFCLRLLHVPTGYFLHTAHGQWRFSGVPAG